MSFDKLFTKIFLLDQLHGGFLCVFLCIFFFFFAFHLVNISHIFISLIWTFFYYLILGIVPLLTNIEDEVQKWKAETYMIDILSKNSRQP